MTGTTRTYRTLTADHPCPLEEFGNAGPPLDFTVRLHGPHELCCFSDDYVASMHAGARSDMRSKSRGVILLSALIRDLQRDLPMHANTGVYLYCGPGPSHSKTQQQVLTVPAWERAATIEKSLPPKDYFISNPAMKAAQISIDFQLHGPWTAFLSPQFGLDQALSCAHNDLLDGVSEAALVGGIFALDEPGELATYLVGSHHLVESIFVQYATRAQDILCAPGPLGKYGPLSPLLQKLAGS